MGEVVQSDEEFAGYSCRRLQNDVISLWVTTAVGPRILGLSYRGQENVFALVPGAVERAPSGLAYQLRGGHRLWIAPQMPEMTYAPDDHSLDVVIDERGVRLIQPTEPQTDMQKQMIIELPSDGPRVVVEHIITNQGNRSQELAPWAITQLSPGGFAVLPQSTAATDVLPNRRLVFWPYTAISSPSIQMGDQFIFVHANLTEGMLKIGWPNPVGWLGYWNRDLLFVKRALYTPERDYFDYESSSECYCDPRFLELETLGPKTTLAPGESVSHTEEWAIYPADGLTPDENAAEHLVAQLGIRNDETSE